MRRLLLIAVLLLATCELLMSQTGTSGGNLAPNASNVTNKVVKGGAGVLYSVQFYNGNAALRYVQIFDATSLPSNGAVSVVAPIPLNPTSTGVIDFGPP